MGNRNTIRKIAGTALLLMMALSAGAQKKQISQAKDILKEGKTPEKAVALMDEALKDSANRANTKLWSMLFHSLTAVYDQNNEKLYLKQNQDTATLFNTTYRLFKTAFTLDSLDTLPDRKGRVEPKYRQRNAAYLNAIRPNLFNGGAYAVRKRQLKEAIDFFDMYLACARQPMFAAYEYTATDQHYAQAAYWAMYCASHQGFYDDALAYYEHAQRDSSHRESAIQYQAEAFLHKQDTTKYVDALRRGFQANPLHPFFFPRLVEHYEQSQQLDSAMQVVDRALQCDSTNRLFRFAQSNVYLNSRRYEECIAVCKALLAENDSTPDIYYNMGVSYFNEAIDIEKQLMNSKMTKSQRQKAMKDKQARYEAARPFLERYRQLAPDRERRWAAPLYTIYLNLNMGKEFDEMERIIRYM